MGDERGHESLALRRSRQIAFVTAKVLSLRQMRAELTTALACLLTCLAITVGRVLYFTNETYYVVLRPTLIERTWQCDPDNGRSALCDGHEANRSFFRGMGFPEQSCADAYWLKKYAKDIAYPDGSTTKMTLMFSVIAKRDSDVPTVCQASPRGVATKAIVEADLRFNRAQGGNRRGACRFINC